MDRVAWWAIYRLWGCKESDTTECLSTEEIKRYKLTCEINKLGKSIYCTAKGIWPRFCNNCKSEI